MIVKVAIAKLMSTTDVDQNFLERKLAKYCNFVSAVTQILEKVAVRERIIIANFKK